MLFVDVGCWWCSSLVDGCGSSLCVIGLLLIVDWCRSCLVVVVCGGLSLRCVLAIVCSALYVGCRVLLVVDVTCCLWCVVVCWLLSVECCCVMWAFVSCRWGLLFVAKC